MEWVKRGCRGATFIFKDMTPFVSTIQYKLTPIQYNLTNFILHYFVNMARMVIINASVKVASVKYISTCQ